MSTEQTPESSANLPKQPLDEASLAKYTALDPNAAISVKPWEFVASSRTMKRIAIIWVIIVMIVHIFMGLVVGIGYTGAAVTTIDKWAFIGIGLVISVVCYIGLSRPRIRANSDGVEVRNFIGTRFYPWTVIYGLSFPRGSRMARLELPEFEFMPVWALQAADRNQIVEKITAFRALEAKYMPQD
ncbi:PH domain-containing protein [Corynebacterium caspium]|uniref:PH domain-containing protein n=1 Tax=Corynebacterium caspium TaxID=234828 RepID=UPI00036BBA1A|nr:PH domain-containing protein [Corynebacterium caspium]WKD59231.1 hypothetical protein CCASP_04170 [Corynebacterium caspium DSM 44850]